MKRATPAEKAQRLQHANALLETISKYGRRFFFNEKNNVVAKFAIGGDNHIYFIDDYTLKAVYTAYRGRWRGFSHGGTLRQLVEALSYYIKTGQRLSIDWIGPERFDQSNIWGYSEDQIAKCRSEALLNPAIKPVTTEAP